MQPNIMIIVIDSARPDGFSCYGAEKETTPAIDRLADEGTQFMNAFAAGGWTAPSHAAMFTGKLPSETNSLAPSPKLDAEETLASRLKDVGYDTIGVSAAAHITQSAGYGNGFNDYINVNQNFSRFSFNLPLLKDSIFHRIFGRRNRASFMTDIIKQKLDDTKEPFFLFANYQNAHYPYRAPFWIRRRFERGGGDRKKLKKLLSLSIRERDEKLLNGDITCTDEEWTLLKSWYRAELHRTDRYINSILKHLERTEQLDNTLIVITADHGDEFGEHNLFSHGHLYDSCLHVPLIMKGPNIPAEERTELVSHLDILPTFTSTADADPQPSDGGQSLFPSDGFNREAVPAEKGGDPDGDNPILDGAASAARTSEYKYIQYENKEDELYRVSEDPQEQHNLLQAETEVVDRLSSLSPDTPTVNAHEQKYADMADPSVRKRLEDLGYL